jgi:hypothetical protein
VVVVVVVLEVVVVDDVEAPDVVEVEVVTKTSIVVVGAGPAEDEGAGDMEAAGPSVVDPQPADSSIATSKQAARPIDPAIVRPR